MNVSLRHSCLPSRKRPYAGLNAGYGWGTNSNTTTSLWNSGSFGEWDVRNSQFTGGAPFVGGALGTTHLGMTQSGFIGGGQIGYNYQWNQNFVVGIEADIQGTAMRGSSTSNGVFGGGFNGTTLPNNYGYNVSQNGYGINSVSAGLDYLGTARGRIGYLWSPTMLIYGTAGLAYGGAYANVSTNRVSNTNVRFTGNLAGTQPINYPAAAQTFIGSASSNALLVGYSAGGGVEWMFMPNWSLKFEGLYYNLGNMNISTTALAAAAYGAAARDPITGNAFQAYAGPGALSGNTSVNYQGVIARAGVNYHFNFGTAPVVAKF